MYVHFLNRRFFALAVALAVACLLGAGLLAASALSAPDQGPGPSDAGTRTGGESNLQSETSRRILVRFEPGTEPDDRAGAREAAEAEFVKSFSLVPRLQLVEVPEAADRSGAIEILENDPGVAYAEPDLIRRLEVTNPNDTFYRSPNFYLWGLDNTGQSFTVGSTNFTGTPDADIDAPEAWDLSRGSSDVTVAVIDSGIQLNHPDLSGNLWTNDDEIAGNGIDDDANGRVDDVNGWDFVNSDNNPADDDGHGTHVAGTVGAVGNNNAGVTGVAWDVELMPLKACNAAGSCSISATVAALGYAVANGAMISNNSYGGIGSPSTSELNAITAARNAGHLYITAAGNDGLNTDLPGNAHYPSNYGLDNIVSVASTTLNDGLSSFSNFGSTSVDLGAPGSQIISTWTSSSYVWANGTSMASPQVAGVAALIKARKPGWTYSQIRSRLTDHTRSIAALAGKSVSGGVVNAYDALLFAPDPPAIGSEPTGSVSSTSASLAFTGETVGAGVTFECRIDAGSWSSCTSPRTYSGLSQGSHTFEVRQTDQAGNASSAASRTWTVDTVAPSAPSITSGPSGFVSSTSASLSFTGEASATFQCRIDAGSWSSCTSPRTYSGLPQGNRTFEVRQTDQAGNTSTAAARTWTVDTVAPSAPSITAGPSGFVPSASASFSFTGEATATFQCRLDGGPWGSCTSPQAYPSLSEGSHTFEVRQTDQAGNTSVDGTRTWTVDTVAPVAPAITGGPSGTVESDDATFEFTGEPSATFECRLDLTVWEACSSPKTYFDLAQGPHTFEVRQADQAGNTSGGETRSWSVNSLIPVAPSITAGPTGAVSSGSATFSFTGEATATFQCRLDGGPWEACSSPRAYTSLPEGSRTFEVRQIDETALESEPAARTWTVDTTAPAAPVIGSGPKGQVNSTTATFSFSGEPGATFECRVDGGAWNGCSSPRSLIDLDSGDHVFEVRQFDEADNVSSPVAETWTVLEVATVQPQLAGTDETGAVLFEGAPEGFTYLCAIGSEALHPCENPFSPAGLTDGSYPIQIVIEDPEGNLSPPLATELVVDGAPEPPEGTASVAIDGDSPYARTPSVDLGLIWPAGTRRVVVSNDVSFTGPAFGISASKPWTLATGQGPREVSVRFLGPGDKSLGTVSDSIFLDPRRPSLKTARLVRSVGKVRSVRIRASDSGSGLARLALSTRRSRPGAGARPTKVMTLTGSKTVRARLSSPPRWAKVRDRAGNWSAWRAVSIG